MFIRNDTIRDWTCDPRTLEPPITSFCGHFAYIETLWKLWNEHEMTQWKCFVPAHLLFVTIYGLMWSSSVKFKIRWLWLASQLPRPPEKLIMCDTLSCRPNWANFASVNWGIFNFTCVGTPIGYWTKINRTWLSKDLKVSVLQAMSS